MGITSLVVLCFLTGVVATMAAVYNVMDFGAVGDGETDDSKSLLKAWNKACADAGSPTYLIPSGRTFLLGQIEFKGSCNGSVHVQLLGNLVAPNRMWSNRKNYWIRFKSIDRLTVEGNGVIDGQGPAWWDCKSEGTCGKIPDSMRFESCDKLQVSGLTLVNSSSKHLTVSRSATVDITGITISATNSSPNTDGLHIEECRHVRVTNCHIGTGDDCISIGTGTYDINISQITCGPGHGISIGSLGEAGSRATVEGVRVSDCSFDGSSNGARIKTWQGGSGYVRGVVFKNMQFSAVRHPIIIDQYYCNKGQLCPNKTSAVQVSDVTYAYARGWGVEGDVIHFACSKTVPCTGIVVSDVNITTTKKVASSSCINAHGRAEGLVQPSIPCLSNGYKAA